MVLGDVKVVSQDRNRGVMRSEWVKTVVYGRCVKQGWRYTM